ncbi:hypothetical protein NQ317_019320 [Molorchus minor]|uniref:TRAF3-interacting protein 1 C-terminal domain-containing protein n=1 Tax=Molorchus minor TaxID=1323400 RepID=A0ABQ9J4R3_9CUCU|nr:hypothetical protein NQ317_019320 [Molorchus minor]
MGNINVIIENIDNIDEEETVVIQSSSNIVDEITSSVDVPEENKGQLVEQILEQIQGEEDGGKRVNIDWEDDGFILLTTSTAITPENITPFKDLPVFHNKDGTSKDINHLRSLIQTLPKTANPLGKLLNYLHEDIDAMHGELQMWTNTKKQLFSEIQKTKKYNTVCFLPIAQSHIKRYHPQQKQPSRISAESNKPLLAHLQQLSEEIKKQEHEIINVRSNIFRNETRIKELLDI